MPDSFNLDDFADPSGYWYNHALVTSSKLGQMAINEKTLFDYQLGCVMAGGKVNWTISSDQYYFAGAVTFATDNELNVLLGTPEFSEIPHVHMTIINDNAQQFGGLIVPKLRVLPTVYGFTWRVQRGGKGDSEDGGFYWLAIGPGTVS